MSKPTARLERLCLRLQPYKMELVYQPGISNQADFMSRHPVNQQNNKHISWIDRQTENVCINAILEYEQAESGISLNDIREETAKDETLQKLVNIITSQDWQKADKCLWPYKLIQNELAVVNGIILRGDRIIMPKKLQAKAIKIAHSSHQGIVKTKSFLRETIWFPGIDKCVEQAVRNCLQCQAATHLNQSNREPLNPTKLPTGPWQEVSADFCGPFRTGEYILVVTDSYSKFPEIEILTSLTAKCVIPKFDAIFARQGIPDTCILKTDNGPPFNGELFARWSRTIGFQHRKITPLWPRANGESERLMKTIEKAIRISMLEKGNWKQTLYQFLRHYMATPHSSTGITPSEMLNGRKLRTELPTVTSREKSAISR